MARNFGKDKPERFLDGALDGDIGEKSGPAFQDSMTSNELKKYPVDRKSQHILTPFALDNVGKVYDRFETSLKDTRHIAGGPENLAHSLTGASAVQEGVGDVSGAKKVIIPNH